MSWTNRIVDVDSRVLLAYYAIIPASFLLIAADALFFNYAVRDFFPDRPEYYLWYLIIFNLPHIVASLVTCADREYVHAYKKPLIKGFAMAIGLTSTVPFIIGYTPFIIFMAFYTLYHVVMQQYGLSLMLLRRPPNLFFKIWKWLSIAGGGLMYMHVYLPVPKFTDFDFGMLGLIVTVLSAPFGLIFFWQMAVQKDISWVSKLYFLGTYLVVIATSTCFAWGYPFLLVLIPRFIHDATAFTVYAVHDHNRNLTVQHNWIYRTLKPLHISPMLLCFPIAAAIGGVLTATQYHSMFILGVIIVITLVHYSMESSMWKRGMPHRQHVNFRIV